jgi:hypothetical protein
MRTITKVLLLALVMVLGAGTAYAAFSNGDDVSVKVSGKVIGTVSDGRLVVTTPNGPILAASTDVTAATTTTPTTPTTTTNPPPPPPPAKPTLTGLSPTHGPEAGGTTVTITGSNFTGATNVWFGAYDATNLTVVSDTQITVKSPYVPASTVDVVVNHAGVGTSTTSAASKYTYDAPAPPATSFVDDFNGAAGSKPDSTKWTDYGGEDRPCGAYVGWGNIMCGASESLDGSGHLIIPASASAGSGIQTKGLFGATYGTFSAWIKMPTQSGYWPGFWLLNGSQTGSELQTGETDIVETYTTWAGANSRLHAWNGGSEVWESSNILYAQSACLSCAYHKYSAKIEPGAISFFFDDVLVSKVLKQGTWYWGPDVTRPNFIILDLAVGGAGQAAPTASAQMLVDRVEVTP